MMKNHYLDLSKGKKSLILYFVLVFTLSAPLWLAGAFIERFMPDLLVNLPLSSLMAFCPITAALILVWREKGPAGAKELLKRCFDFKRVPRAAWYLPVLFLMPLTMALEYVILWLVKVPLPDFRFPVLLTPAFFLIFFIAGLGEEVGWQGYAFEPMQDGWNALVAALVLGVVWAVWHIIPFFQANNAPGWVAWQCVNLVVTRVLFAWLYNNSGKSVFVAALFHAMYNLSTMLFPNYGSHYDPLVAVILIAAIVLVVVFLWGPKTLARFRYARTEPEIGFALPMKETN